MAKRILLIMILLFSIFSLTYAQNDPVVAESIVYLETDAVNLRLDIYIPDTNDDPVPTVVIFHGGRGNKRDHISWATHLMRQGYAVIVPNYRTFPVDNTDGFCAVAWAHSNATVYNLDTDNLFIMGWSFGGGVASEIGMVDSDYDIFEEDPCPYLAPDVWTSGTILLAATSRPRGVRWQDDVPPLIWLDGSEAPFLLIHGAVDTVISVEESEDLLTQLEVADIPVELVILPEAGHFFPIYGIGQEEAWEVVDNFLIEQINTEDLPDQTE